MLPSFCLDGLSKAALGFNLALLPLIHSPSPGQFLFFSLPSCFLFQSHHSIQPKPTKDALRHSTGVGGVWGGSPRFNSAQTDVIHQPLCEEATGAQEGRKRKTENNGATRKVFRSWTLQWKQTGNWEQCTHHDLIVFHILSDPGCLTQAAHLR